MRNSVEIESLAKKSPLESFAMARCTKSGTKTNKLQSQIKIRPNSRKKSKLFHKSPKYGEKSKPKFEVQTESEKSKFEGFGREKSKLAALVPTNHPGCIIGLTVL